MMLLFQLSACSQNFIQPLDSSRPFESPESVSDSPFQAESFPADSSISEKMHPNYQVVGSFGTGDQSYVRSLYADDHSVWVGTTEGIIQVANQSAEMMQVFTTKDGLLSPYIFTINKDKQGVYWFGTNNGGLSRYDGESWKTYLPSDGLADFWVYGMDFAEDGTMWIATWNGVSHFDGENFRNYNTGDGLADRWVYAIAVDAKGALWFGTEGGVSRLDRQGKWRTWRHRDGLGAPNKYLLDKSENTGFGTKVGDTEADYKHGHNLSVLDVGGNETYNENYVFSMAIDRTQQLWFGTWGGGVSRFDGQQWRNFTTDDGLAGNIVYAVAVDPHDGALWFGTNHGVSRFDGENWMTLTTKDGLADENVYAIAIDSERRVWLGQKGGVDVLALWQGRPTGDKRHP